MTIGVNALYLIPGGVGGTEIYLRSLLAALARIDSRHSYRVFTNRETGADLVPAAENFEQVPQAVKAVNRPARILHEQFRLPLGGVDVLLNPGFTAPLFTRVPQVTVIHDLQHKRHPEHFRWFDLPAWRLLVWGAVKRSRRIIAVSEATRADLIHFYGVSESMLRTIPHGVDEAFFQLRRRPEAMVLCVSTLHPHKNLDRLVRAFGRFHRGHPEYRLVLAGMRGFHAEAVVREIAASAAAESIRVTGWIPREDLLGLYSRAAMFVYPSTFEGFGMPVLEALAAGIPTACSNIAPLEEIASGAAITFDPGNEEAIAEAMEHLAAGGQAGGGVERARMYSWETAARLTLDALTIRDSPDTSSHRV